MAGVYLQHRNPSFHWDVLKAMAQSARASVERPFLGDQNSYGAMLAAGSIGLVVGLHLALGGHAAVEALYLVPAWLSYRAGGKKLGLAVLVFAAFAATVVSTDGFSALSLLYRLGAFGGLGYLVVRTLDGNGSFQNSDGKPESSTEESSTVAVMIDCEGFMTLDDYYGSGTGEYVVRTLIRVLEDETRNSDLVARIGPTEFAVVLTDTDIEGASRIMEHVQARFEQLVMDAGYECNITFGSAPIDTESRSVRDLLNQTHPNEPGGSAFLN